MKNTNMNKALLLAGALGLFKQAREELVHVEFNAPLATGGDLRAGAKYNEHLDHAVRLIETAAAAMLQAAENDESNPAPETQKALKELRDRFGRPHPEVKSPTPRILWADGDTLVYRDCNGDVLWTGAEMTGYTLRELRLIDSQIP
jgi:hypothetical protein